MRNKGFIPIILLILVALAIAGGYYLGKANLSFHLTSPFPPSSPTFEAPSDWKIYTNASHFYTFRYPKEAGLDTSNANDPSYPSAKVIFTGEKQVRTQTEIIDGYFFVVTALWKTTHMSLEEAAQEMFAKTKSSCPASAKIGNITQSQIAEKPALTYKVGGCLGDYTISLVANNLFIFSINQFYAGDVQKEPEYERTTNQILSTFKFLD